MHMRIEADESNTVNARMAANARANATDGQGEDPQNDLDAETERAPVPVDAGIQSPANEDSGQGSQGAEAAPIGLRFPGEEAEKIVAPKDVPVAAKAVTGGMVRVRGAIMHRTPSLLISNETMALFEYAASVWPDKYGKGADLSDDLSRFVDEVVISFFKIYGIGPVIYRSRESLVGVSANGNGNANGAVGAMNGRE